MPVRSIDACESVYLIDTMLANTPGFCASFFLDRDRRMLIDAGSATTVDEILNSLDALGIAPESVDIILVTHLHIDHAGGIAELAVVCENATIYCHPISASYLTDEEKLERLVESSKDAVGGMADAYEMSGTVPAERIETIEEGASLDLGDTVIDVLHTSGHAPHHFSLYDRSADALFLIDEGAAHIHGHSMPNASPPNFDPDATIDSLERFQRYDTATLLYCHFGVVHETLPQLDEDIAIVRQWMDKMEAAWERHRDEEAVIDSVLEEYDQEIEIDVVRWSLEMHIRGILTYLKRRDREYSRG